MFLHRFKLIIEAIKLNMTSWNLSTLLGSLSTPESAVAFCKERGLIAGTPECRYCLHQLSWAVKVDWATGLLGGVTTGGAARGLVLAASGMAAGLAIARCH